MILGIFRRKKKFFIDENVFFSMSNHDYSIREKHNKLAILVVMIIATTFTVCLAYRHYRNTLLVQFLVIAYMYVLRLFFVFGLLCVFFIFVLFFFLLQNAPIAMIFDDAIYLFIIFFCILFQCYCVQVPY